MKELRITSSKIIVQSNPLMERGYSIDHKVKGILPKCRNVTDLHISPSYGSIHVRSLWSHNGSATVRPEDWAGLIANSPVVPTNINSMKIEVTDEIRAEALAYVLGITSCPAVKSSKDVHPNYKPTFTNMEVVNAKIPENIQSAPEPMATLLLEGIRTTGALTDEALLPVEERMTEKGFKTAQAFLAWLREHHLTIGHGTIHLRFHEFQHKLTPVDRDTAYDWAVNRA